MADNGSQDDSLRILEQHPIRPKLIRLDRNFGFAQAVNLGIEQGRGELIALFNNDAIAEPAWLEQLSEAAANFPEMDFFASLILQSESREKIESAGVGYSWQARPYPFLENETVPAMLKPAEVFLASGAGVMIRKKLLDRIGKFDPDYFAYLEDIDFFLRARLAGAKGMLVPGAVIYHFSAGTDLSDQPGGKRMESGKRVYWISRNRWYLIGDNWPLPIIALLWPWICWGWLRGFGYHLFYSGRILQFLAGTVTGLFSFPLRGKKRKAVKKIRTIKLGELLSWMKKGRREIQ